MALLEVVNFENSRTNTVVKGVLKFKKGQKGSLRRSVFDYENE